MSVLKKVVGMTFWICGVPGRLVHGQGEGAERDGAGDQPLGQIALAEHFGGERIDGEHHDEQRDAAVGQEAADQDDGQNPPFCARPTRSPKLTMDLAKPDISMTLPNSAPSRKTGK